MLETCRDDEQSIVRRWENRICQHAVSLRELVFFLALLKNEGEKRFPSVSDIDDIGEITAISTYLLYQKIEGELLLQSFKTHFIEWMTALLVGRKCGMLPVQHFIFWRSMEKFSLNFDFDHVGTSISPLKVSYVPIPYQAFVTFGTVHYCSLVHEAWSRECTYLSIIYYVRTRVRDI